MALDSDLDGDESRRVVDLSKVIQLGFEGNGLVCLFPSKRYFNLKVEIAGNVILKTFPGGPNSPNSSFRAARKPESAAFFKGPPMISTGFRAPEA